MRFIHCFLIGKTRTGRPEGTNSNSKLIGRSHQTMCIQSRGSPDHCQIYLTTFDRTYKASLGALHSLGFHRSRPLVSTWQWSGPAELTSSEALLRMSFSQSSPSQSLNSCPLSFCFARDGLLQRYFMRDPRSSQGRGTIRHRHHHRRRPSSVPARPPCM